jgi:predicted ATPase/DNA-binding SARP family transcriptional activator
MLEIRTLGGLSILKDGEAVNELGSRKAEALLVYLAVEGGQHPRKTLAALLWPESPEKQAASSLRVTLSTLRKTLGSYLEISRTDVGVNANAGIEVDLVQLEQELAHDPIDRALEKVQGDFLEGFHIRDSLEFEDWRLFEQERIRRLIMDALHASIADMMQKEEFKRGLQLTHHLLRLDPLDELAHQQSMTLLALDGQRSAALLQYEHCAKILQSELGVEPSEATQVLFQQISSGDRLSDAIPLQPKHNLPAQPTSFIGREKELAQIGEMMVDPHCRLITLIGPGGIGKTRLALQAADAFLHSFEDGTYFVPLGPIPSPDAILSAITHTLSFSYDIATTLDPKSQLLDYLRHRSILLVMDGFEHLIEGAGLLSDILANAADLKLLVTSRARLGLQAEWAFQVEGLPIAEDTQASEMEDSTALALFYERARQVRADFQLTENERQHAIQICQFVEGMPLGIELAAAWVSALSCEEIAEEMEKSLDFLSASMRDLPLKHRSLRTAFDHSWRLLTEEQQDILRKLSVFRGAFSRSAALYVVGANLTQLSSLIGKSLLRRNASGEFEMHELLRQHAEEKLDKDPTVKEDVQERHASYYIELLSQRESELMGPRMNRVKAEISREIGNIRTAANWAIQKWNTEAAISAVERFFNFYAVRGWHEGREAFENLARHAAQTGLDKQHQTPQQDPVFLSIRAHQAFFSSNLGLIEEGEALSQECLAPLREKKMRNELSICLHNLGVNDCFRGDYKLSIQRLEEAIVIGEAFQTLAWRSYFLWLGYVFFMIGEYERGMESLQICYDLFDEINSLWGKAFALSKMGLASDGLKEHTQAMHYHQEALSIFETTGDQAGKGYALSRMSMGAYFLGNYEDALRFGQEGYDAFQEIGHRWGICISLCRLGFAYLGLGEIAEAKDRLYEALRLAQEHQMTPLILNALAGLACVLVREGETERSLELYQLVHEHPQNVTIYLDLAERWLSDIDLPSLRDESTESGKRDDGRSLDQIVERILEEQREIEQPEYKH